MPIDACDFYAPLTIYIHKSGDEYHAAIDPFSVYGVGRSREQAFHEAVRCLKAHLVNLSSAVDEYGAGTVEIFTPLPKSEKKNKPIAAFLIASTRKIKLRAEDVPLHPKPMESLRDILPRIHETAVTTLMPVTA